MLIEHDKGILVAIFVRGVVAGENDVISSDGFAESLRYEGLVRDIVGC